MGALIYGPGHESLEIDDRTLLHLQITIANKLRLGESFNFSWSHDPQLGSGRSVMWIDPSVPIYFRFTSGKPANVNRRWLDELAASANRPDGFVMVPEPEPS
ncbi:MAG TPA: hypothetical protein PK282_00780 [Rhodoglobus sp.]|nr:hypothetical protein [Rhodoglobus sp.]HPM50743.1 hypothetical protein [Rhodoglobus sp.]